MTATVYWGGRHRTPAGIARLRATARARQRALRIVARMHAEEFAALWTDRGAKDSPGYDARRDAAERAVARNHPEDRPHQHEDPDRYRGRHRRRWSPWCSSSAGSASGRPTLTGPSEPPALRPLRPGVRRGEGPMTENYCRTIEDQALRTLCLVKP